MDRAAYLESLIHERMSTLVQEYQKRRGKNNPRNTDQEHRSN